MKEIGGYFGLEESDGVKEFYPDLIALNTARNALVYICKARDVKKVYIPYFLCDTIPLVCDREHISYAFYHVDNNMRPVFDYKLKDGEYLYLVNYYGQISDKEILELKKKYNNIILDNVQAFFQKPIKGIDTIYSCRKFVGVPDGAYLSTDCILKDELSCDVSSSRLKHIVGRNRDGAEMHYNEYKNNEKLLYDIPLMKMSEITHSMLKRINYSFIKTRRESNFKLLFDSLKELNKFDVVSVPGPFAYPFYIDNGNVVRKQLLKEKIYIATLWPNVMYGNEGHMAINFLPLPCDQRYDEGDMKRIVEVILKCMNH